MSTRARVALLRANAVLLGLAAVGGLAMDVLGTFYQRGPAGRLEGDWPAAGIGFIEAHGLALIVAVVLWRGSREPRALWHVIAVATHVLLGSANLTFWSLVFVRFEQLPLGWATTVMHWVLVVLQVWAAAAAATGQAASPVNSVRD
jgi:hypothetical protein